MTTSVSSAPPVQVPHPPRRLLPSPHPSLSSSLSSSASSLALSSSSSSLALSTSTPTSTSASSSSLMTPESTMFSPAHSGRAASLTQDSLYPTYGYTGPSRYSSLGHTVASSWADLPAPRGEPWSPASSAVLSRSASLAQPPPPRLLPRPPAPGNLPRPAIKGAREIERRKQALEALITAREGSLPSSRDAPALRPPPPHRARPQSIISNAMNNTSGNYSRLPSTQTPLSRSSSRARPPPPPPPPSQLPYHGVSSNAYRSGLVQPPHSRRHSVSGTLPLSSSWSSSRRSITPSQGWARAYTPTSSDDEDHGRLPTRSPLLRQSSWAPSRSPAASTARTPSSPFRSPATAQPFFLSSSSRDNGDLFSSSLSGSARQRRWAHDTGFSSTPSSRTVSPTPSHHSARSALSMYNPPLSAISPFPSLTPPPSHLVRSPAADQLRDPRWRSRSSRRSSSFIFTPPTPCLLSTPSWLNRYRLNRYPSDDQFGW